MKKTPFVTKKQVEEIVKTYPTPFHLYDEAGIRANAKAVQEAFAWNKGFREYFAVKATPNPFLLKILKEYDCGCDCSSLTELLMAKACGFDGPHIMFSSNDTPLDEFAYANELGAIINLDDFTHIQCLEDTLGYIPETISCRYNPGGVFELSNGIMDNPGDSKYGMTKDQIIEGEMILESDFVSGDMSEKNGSPDGVFKIVYKQRNATLRGEDYESSVSYFMPFAYNVGFHDATWRKKFGGQIYKTNGSHGCINLPPAFAETLYKTIDVGMPVVAYYREPVVLVTEGAKISNAYSYKDPSKLTP